MKRRWLTVVSVIVTVISLYLAVRGVHLGQMLATLRGVNVWWAIPVFLATLVSVWIRAYRWRIMLEPVCRVSVRHAYSATMIGYMANNLLPMRLGELVRAYSLGRISGVSKSTAFATIVIERAFDLLALLLFLALGLIRYSVAPWVKVSGYVSLGICAGLFLLFALVRWKREAALGLVARLTGRLPGGGGNVVHGALGRFLDGTEVLTRGQHLAWAGLLSLFTWLAVGLGFYLTALAFGIRLSLDASLLLMVICALAVMLPSGPGFVGTFEVGARYGLMVFGVSAETALGYAVFYHAVQFIPVTLLGLYHLWRENLSLTRAVSEEGRAI